jgi:hypothetical protein
MNRVLLRVLLLGAIGAAAMPGRAPAQSLPADVDKKPLAKQYVDAGLAAQEAGDYDTAITFYRKAYQLLPHPALLFNMAQAHRLAGQLDQALALYRRYLAEDPGGAQAATARGLVTELVARRAEARRAEQARSADARKAERARSGDARKAEQARSGTARKAGQPPGGDARKAEPARSGDARKPERAASADARKVEPAPGGDARKPEPRGAVEPRRAAETQRAAATARPVEPHGGDGAPAPGAGQAVVPAPSTAVAAAPAPSTAAGVESPAGEPRDPGQPGETLRIAGLVTGAAGVAAVGIGIGFGLHARSLSSDLSQRHAVYDPAKIRAGERANTIAIAGMAGGAVLIATGAALYWWGHAQGSASERVSVAPLVGERTAGVIISGALP